MRRLLHELLPKIKQGRRTKYGWFQIINVPDSSKCPVCGGADLVHDTRDLPKIYKGEMITVTAVTGDFCPACKEFILDAIESDRVMKEMRLFAKPI